jgi:sugar phosphate isomerase/epimerase
MVFPIHGFNKPGKKSIGLQLYTVRDAIQENLENTLSKVASIGYNSLELAGYHEGNFYGRAPSAFKILLKGLGMQVNSCHVLFDLTKQKGSCKTMEKWKQAAESVKKVGAGYLVFPYFDPKYRDQLDNYKLLADNLNRIGEICSQNEVQLAYHNHDYEFYELEGTIPYHLLMERTDPEKVKMEIDLYWIIKAGKDPIDYFAKFPGRFPLWHVKDMENSPEKFFAEVGAGTIDFKSIFQKANLAGLDYFFVEQDYSRRDPLKSIEMSYEYLVNADFV